MYMYVYICPAGCKIPTGHKRIIRWPKEEIGERSQ